MALHFGVGPHDDSYRTRMLATEHTPLEWGSLYGRFWHDTTVLCKKRAKECYPVRNKTRGVAVFPIETRGEAAMKFLATTRFLAVYSGVLTAIFAITILGGFAGPKKSSFEEIDVQRINIVEPDGTLRLVLSNKATAPGLIIKGKEYPDPDRQTAGMLFFDDEGTENGGLIFGGSKDKDGRVESWGHLSFDQYDQDQVFTVDAGEENGRRRSGIAFWDRGDWPITEAIEAQQRIQKLPPAQREPEWQKFGASHSGDTQRAYLGRSSDHSVGLRLMDQSGKDRIRLRVNPDGSPVLQFLDASGKVVSQLPVQGGTQSPASRQ